MKNQCFQLHSIKPRQSARKTRNKIPKYTQLIGVNPKNTPNL